MKIIVLSKGFTLIEVLIALVVLAISLTAVYKAISYNIQDSAYVEDKAMAEWVGMNVIARAQTKLINTTPNLTLTGSSEMRGKIWFWKISEQVTPGDPYVAQLKVIVRASLSAQPLVRLGGYIAVTPLL